MLHVHDNGVENLQNSLKIRIKLTNENNHDPKFEHKVSLFLIIILFFLNKLMLPLLLKVKYFIFSVRWF